MPKTGPMMRVPRISITITAAPVTRLRPSRKQCRAILAWQAVANIRRPTSRQVLVDSRRARRWTSTRPRARREGTSTEAAAGGKEPACRCPKQVGCSWRLRACAPSDALAHRPSPHVRPSQPTLWTWAIDPFNVLRAVHKGATNNDEGRGRDDRPRGGSVMGWAPRSAKISCRPLVGLSLGVESTCR